MSTVVATIQPLNRRELNAQHKQRRKHKGVSLTHRAAKQHALRQYDDDDDDEKAFDDEGDDAPYRWNAGQADTRVIEVYQQQQSCAQQVEDVLGVYAQFPSDWAEKRHRDAHNTVLERCKDALYVLQRIRSHPNLIRLLGVRALPIDKYFVLGVIAHMRGVRGLTMAAANDEEERDEAAFANLCIAPMPELNELVWSDERRWEAVTSLVESNVHTPMQSPLTIRFKAPKQQQSASGSARRDRMQHSERVARAKNELKTLYNVWYNHDCRTATSRGARTSSSAWAPSSAWAARPPSRRWRRCSCWPRC